MAFQLPSFYFILPSYKQLALPSSDSYTIIVVGVGDGREEDLIRISLASNRIITATNMSQLTGGGIKYQQLTEIVKNPESGKITFCIFLQLNNGSEMY